MNSFSNVPIDFDALPKAEEIYYRPIIAKYLWVSICTTLLSYLFFGGLFYAFLYSIDQKKNFLEQYNLYIIMGFIVLLIIQLIILFLGFKWKGYVIREKDIIYRTGLIVRKKVHIPFNRVQHCEVAQNILERGLHLAKLKIYTAGGSRSDLSIPGLTNDEALKMKQFILKKTQTDSSQKRIYDESE